MPSLGSDGETLLVSVQMFREMQARDSVSPRVAPPPPPGKEVRNNAHCRPGQLATKLNRVRLARSAEWATINGAKAFRLDGRIEHALDRQEGRNRD